MSKFTPGPWRYEAGKDTDMGGFVGPKGENVCSFGDCETYYPTEGAPPSDADTALIEAAPDLLARLKARCASCFCDEDGSGYNQPSGRGICTDCKADALIIAKAEGK